MISSKSLKYTVRILLGTLIGVYLGNNCAAEHTVCSGQIICFCN